MSETEFSAGDFAHTAHLLRSADDAVVSATLSNNINIILAALDRLVARPFPTRSELTSRAMTFDYATSDEFAAILREQHADYDEMRNEAQGQIEALDRDNDALREALEPFAAVLADVGEDEDDVDLYQTMSPENRRAEPIRVGHLRRARAALSKAQPEGK